MLISHGAPEWAGWCDREDLVCHCVARSTSSKERIFGKLLFKLVRKCVKSIEISISEWDRWRKQILGPMTHLLTSLLISRISGLVVHSTYSGIGHTTNRASMVYH